MALRKVRLGLRSIFVAEIDDPLCGRAACQVHSVHPWFENVGVRAVRWDWQVGTSHSRATWHQRTSNGPVLLCRRRMRCLELCDQCGLPSLRSTVPVQLDQRRFFRRPFRSPFEGGKHLGIAAQQGKLTRLAPQLPRLTQGSSDQASNIAPSSTMLVKHQQRLRPPRIEFVATRPARADLSHLQLDGQPCKTSSTRDRQTRRASASLVNSA